MRLKQQLLAVSEAYCAAVQRSEARVSTRIYGSGARLRSLREGKDMLSGNVEAGLLWFSDHWPEGVAWPSEVLRPAPTPPPTDPASPAAERSA